MTVYYNINRGVAVTAALTGVVDTLAVGPVEGGVAEVGAAGGADEHALREHRAEDDHRHDGLREVHRLGGRVDDASVDGAEDDASAGSDAIQFQRYQTALPIVSWWF